MKRPMPWAMFCLAIWMTGTVFVAVVATQNFFTIDRLLGRIAERILSRRRSDTGLGGDAGPSRGARHAAISFVGAEPAVFPVLESGAIDRGIADALVCDEDSRGGSREMVRCRNAGNFVVRDGRADTANCECRPSSRLCAEGVASAGSGYAASHIRTSARDIYGVDIHYSHPRCALRHLDSRIRITIFWRMIPRTRAQSSKRPPLLQARSVTAHDCEARFVLNGRACAATDRACSRNAAVNLSWPAR